MVLFKQWGSWGLLNKVQKETVGKRQTMAFLRVDGTPVQMIKVGKAVAGRVLKGKEYTEFPLEKPR